MNNKHKKKLYCDLIRGKIHLPKQIYITLITQTKVNYFNNLIATLKKYSKAMWYMINTQLSRNTKNATYLFYRPKYLK